ncbi:MAG: TonB-dependent receptor plug domain-containing protein [Rhodospirillaceae bacterium]
MTAARALTRRWIAGACGLVGLGLGTHGAAADTAGAGEVPDLSPLSIEELASLEITSVSRRAEPMSGAPASVYVVTPDQIRRFGAETIPDALALAPNLSVRRLTALNYAIGGRGFSTYESSNKLLALVDGRSIYSSLHSGVFWSNYDLMLDDVARIEVVGGPGGTLWGANAVNGVINIITKSSKDTQGGLVDLTGGSLDDTVAARYGGRINDGLTYRVYVKGQHRGAMRTNTGAAGTDAFDNVQGGFRSDWEGQTDQVTFQGDILDGSSTNDVTGITVRGGNGLLRWRHAGEDGATSAQAYVDTVQSRSPGVNENAVTYDVDLQHNRAFGGHDVVIGGGYRTITDKFVNTLNIFVFAQPKRTINLGNAYAQDTVHLADTLRFIAGIKFEHNDFTGWEIMPSGRLAWQPTSALLLWGAVSRAVRTPSRIDRELQALPILVPASEFKSEQLLAYEAGARVQASGSLSFSVTGYYNIYQSIRDTGFAPGGGLPIRFGNDHHGHIYGVALWGTYAVADWWHIDAGFTALHKDIVLKPGHTAANIDQSLGDDPDYDASIKSSVSLTQDVDFDVALHFADALPAPVVPAYTEINARLAWRPVARLELSVQGKNLLHDHHAESGPPLGRLEVPRSVTAGLRWAF